MKLDLSRNNAENIFENDIGSVISVRLIQDNVEFQGILLKIFCNTFIIHTESDKIEMFRYEDVRWLMVLNSKIVK